MPRSCSPTRRRRRALPPGRRRSGSTPWPAFADHGGGAAGEALGIMLRPGNARIEHRSRAQRGSQPGARPAAGRQRRRVLIRTDSGGGTHDFLAWLSRPGRRLHYSIGMTITEDMHQAILQLPDRVWEPAYDAAGQVRPGAWVAELTGLLDLSSWPAGMRVIVRRERTHPGAQLRFHRHRRAPGHLIRHRRPDRAAR